MFSTIFKRSSPKARGIPTAARGFIFATTGEGYTALAIRAAHSVKQHHPDIPVDLFSDTPVDDPVFDQVHALNNFSHRPKMEAIYRSRFENTIYLDADLFVIADIRDVFEVLEHFDIAAALDQNRNWSSVVKIWKREMPAAFPQYNTGLLGVKRSTETDAFFRKWEQEVGKKEEDRDQPSMRELLFLSKLRIATLPAEYNLMNIKQLPCWKSTDCAPRVIHSPALHAHIESDASEIETLEQLLGKDVMKHVMDLADADFYLTSKGKWEWVPPLYDIDP